MYDGFSPRTLDTITLAGSPIGATCCLLLYYTATYPASMMVTGVAAALLLVIFLARRRLPTAGRLLLVSMVGLVVALVSIREIPDNPAGFMVIGAVMALCFANLPLRHAVVIPVVSTLCLLVMFVLVQKKIIVFRPQDTLDVNAGHVWVTMALALILLSLGMGGVIVELRWRLNRQIKSLEAAKERLFSAAYLDKVTGLSNKDYFVDRLRHAVDGGQAGVLLGLKLRGFALLNATAGHVGGDKYIMGVARLLMASSRMGSALPARIRDDTFTVWMPYADDASVSAFAEDMRQALASDALIQNTGVDPLFAWTRHPQDGANSGELMRNLDFALHFAALPHAPSVVGFSAEMEREINEYAALRGRVRDALDQDLFTPVYQLKYTTDGRQVVGVEALARMCTQDGQASPSPAKFIPLLQNEGWAGEFARVMLGKVLADLPTLMDWYGRDVQVSVNVTPSVFKSQDFVQFALKAISASGADMGNMVFELTEDVFISDLEEFRRSFDLFRRAGVKISLDDFGTGFSSLSFLRDFRFDEIKIDKSFIDEIAISRKAHEIFIAICHLIHNVNASVVAEGVETSDQLERVRGHGDYVQGYIYSRPVPLTQLRAPAI